jgi:hypothetical protein
MKVGAEPKKIAILAGLVAIAGYVYVSNSVSDDQPAPSTGTRVEPAPVVMPSRSADTRTPARPPRVAGNPKTGVKEFKPSLRSTRPEDRRDPMSIDPGLRLDLLGRLQTVKAEGGGRSLFEFSQPPAPKAPDVKIPVKPVKPEPPKAVAETKTDGPPPKPAPPPIPLKFYGLSAPPRQGVKRAFFLEGEEIYVAAEGDVIKRRYKVVRIGVNSVVMEDLDHQSEQTLPLVPEQQPT